MKSSLIITLCAFLMLSSCSNDDFIDEACAEAMLEKYNMVPYEDQEINCEVFLELYYYKRKQYFLLGGHCADIYMTPVGCDGNSLFEDWGTAASNDWHTKARKIGIIGISE